MADDSSNSRILEGLFARLEDKARPAVLLLGQNASHDDDGTEALLEAAKKQYGLGDEVPRNFRLLFKIDAAGDYRAVSDWLAERSRNQPFSESLSVISKLSWNGVFTSSICPQVGRAFRASWRMPQDVASASQIPETPQSRHRLTITWLFGRLDEDYGSERAAPISGGMALRQRQLGAATLLGRIPEVVTHYGTLLIEGIDLESDWLSEEQIINVVANLQPGQTHWFSWPANRPLTEELADLQRDGRLTFHTDSLASAFAEAISAGHLKEASTDSQESVGRTVLLGGRAVPIRRGLLSRAEILGRIVDPIPSEALPPLSPETEYGLLREFLRDPLGSGTVWEAAARGFVVARGHDERLASSAKKAIGELSKRRKAVLLMGPAGSGRSVSLARFALDAARSLNCLVYHVDGSIPPPDELVEELTRFAATNDASATILVWDGNRTPTEYQRLVDSAYSRGEKLVVVGSCFVGVHKKSQFDNVSALATLTENERTGFVTLFRRFGLQIDSARLSAANDRLLVLLYRFIQIARPQLGAALSGEAEHFSRQITKHLAVTPKPQTPTGALASALIEAGLVQKGEEVNKNAAAPSWTRSLADELIGTTMAVGRHGASIPLELAVRASVSRDTDAWSKIEQILREIDIVEINSDADGVTRIGPRHQVEARILCDRELGGPQAEMKIFSRLAKEARSGTGLGASSDPEIRFLIELCMQIGPNAPDASTRARYSRFYGQLADALRIRRSSAPLNTELAMQEAVMWREDLISQEDSQKRAPDNAVANVEEAIELLDIAIDAVRKEGRRWRHLRNLRVERATLIGTLTFQLVAKGAEHQELMARLTEVRTECAKIAAVDPSFYHPWDVMLWTMSDALSAPKLTPEDKVVLQVELRSALLEIPEEDLPFDQLETFLERKQKVATLIQDSSLNKDALNKLRAMGSTIPDRLEAMELGGDILLRDNNLPGDDEKLSRACEVLTSADQKNGLDLTGKRLLLRLTWRLVTGRDLFTGERAPTPTREADILTCRRLSEQLVVLAGGDPPHQILFLMAVLMWLDRDYTLAKDTWQRLEEISDRNTAHRIRKHLVMYGPDGAPAVFHGRIVSLRPDSRAGRLRIEETGQQIQISAADFRQRTLRRDENIEAQIAFNYLGPVAIPVE